METLLKHIPHYFRITWIWLLLFSEISAGLCWGGCDETDEGVPFKLLSFTYVSSRGAGLLKTMIGLSDVDLPKGRMKYKVSQYKINYQTTYKGREITASGIVLIPKTNSGISVLSYQHGTITSDSEAPSQLNASDQELILYEAVASTGMMIVVPDFIGFGASAELVHPYYIEEISATTVIDNIYAAKNLAEELGVKLNGRLYLAGYSQGGYATMAAHKYIEQKGIEGFKLQASFPGAGCYDLIAARKYFFSRKVYHQPVYLAYVMYSYRVTLDLATDLSSFFNEPYASIIPDFFDGSLSGAEINKMLCDTLSVLINNDYLQFAEVDARFASITRAFAENSLLDWIPTIRLCMYHGEADETIAFENSLNTYKQLLKNGASESILSLIPIPEATHKSGIIPYVERFVNEISRIERIYGLQ